MAGVFRRGGLRDQGFDLNEDEESGELAIVSRLFTLTIRLPCYNAVKVNSIMHHIPLHPTGPGCSGSSLYSTSDANDPKSVTWRGGSVRKFTESLVHTLLLLFSLLLFFYIIPHIISQL